VTVQSGGESLVSIHFDESRGTVCHAGTSVCVRNESEEPVRVIAVRAEGASLEQKPLATGTFSVTPDVTDGELPITLDARDGYTCVPVTVCTDWSTWKREMKVNDGSAPVQVQLQVRGYFTESLLAFEDIGAGAVSVQAEVSAASL